MAGLGTNTNYDMGYTDFKKGEKWEVKYRGHDRTIIPLVYGTLKNGKDALLCLRSIDHTDKWEIRLFHRDKLNVRARMKYTGNLTERQIDHYLTKHFSTIIHQA